VSIGILIPFELHAQTLDTGLLLLICVPILLVLLLLLCHILPIVLPHVRMWAYPGYVLTVQQAFLDVDTARDCHYPGQHFVCMPNYIANLIEVC